MDSQKFQIREDMIRLVNNGWNDVLTVPTESEVRDVLLHPDTETAVRRFVREKHPLAGFQPMPRIFPVAEDDSDIRTNDPTKKVVKFRAYFEFVLPR